MSTFAGEPSTFAGKVANFLVDDVNRISTERDDFIAISPPLPHSTGVNGYKTTDY